MSTPSTITLKPVKSSQIEAAGHDPATNTLAVKFKRGGNLYHYANFTADDYRQFLAADSQGSHFYTHIKPNKDKYPFTKIS